MIITLSGKAGSGKSTVSRLLAKKLKLRHYSTGDLMREMARERNISLIELNKIAESDDGKIDRELDARTKKLGEEQDGFIIDGRLPWHFIPHATLKVFLETDDEERARRILGANRADEKAEGLSDTIKQINDREASEKKRYQEYYNLDYHDHSHYDIVIDTTNITPEEVVEKVVAKIDKAQKKK